MPTKTYRKKILIFTAILLAGGLLAGLAIVQAKTSSISLDSPVSFPVDI
ncbi:MAG: hypothetical protein OQL16_12660 [Gammaproteobacteria bacterium]|nr:hypothetical protein [Gammaproteobacteria bacterium]